MENPYTPAVLHLGSIRGTSIDVDISFLILCVFFVATDYDSARGIHYSLLWVPVLFISVLFHELAHAGAIGLFGYGSSRIILGGMGGLTYNERRARPWHDMVVSLAGPVSNFILAVLLWFLLLRVAIIRTDPMLIVFVPMLWKANIWWGILNLLPVSPLDGGHAVRNFFRTFLDEQRAFAIAVWIAIIVGSAVAIYGVLTRSWLFLSLLLGWFVYKNYQQWQYFREHGHPGD